MMQEVTFVADAAIKTIQAGESALRKAWSLMEAATEKKRPSEIVSKEAIQRIQGKQEG